MSNLSFRMDGFQNVVLTGGRGALGAAVKPALEALGATVHVPDLDVTDEEQVVAFYEALPPIFASVHLVGAFTSGPLVKTSVADFERMMALNLRSAFLCCREAAKSMQRGAVGGRIVNVVARPALRPEQGANCAAYTASKAALAALTVALATELSPSRILVNAVAPSTMNTAANRASMPDADFSLWPMPESVAEEIAFLASRENAITSGALTPVYGRA